MSQGLPSSHPQVPRKMQGTPQTEVGLVPALELLPPEDPDPYISP